jgi:hypothetical protein
MEFEDVLEGVRGDLALPLGGPAGSDSKAGQRWRNRRRLGNVRHVSLSGPCSRFCEAGV